MTRCKKAGLVLGAVLFGIVNVDAEMFTPPEYFGPADGMHARHSRMMITCPSLAIAPNGRLWASWFTGPTAGEDRNNYVVLATSMDDGKTWEEVCVCNPDIKGPRRAFDPQLWLAPDGKLRWTWTDRTVTGWRANRGNEQSDGLWMAVIDDPCGPFKMPAPPVCIAHGVMLGNPVVLSDGTWCLPTCVWFSDKSSGMTVSTDNGRTFSWRGGATNPDRGDRIFDEHNIIERGNGDLFCMARCKGGIREAVSKDKGYSWTDLKPSRVQHTSSRTALMRLKSGNLLLVKHGPIDKNVGRTRLTAYISKDDGVSWTGGLLLDEREGAAYPNGQERADGLIYMIYDHDRYGAQEVLFATFTEADVLAGKNVSRKVRLRQTVTRRVASSDPARFGTLPIDKDSVLCEGVYPKHIQGVAAGDGSLFWSFTTRLVKTDLEGAVRHVVSVPWHYGDLCVKGDLVYVAVNLGKFNETSGADSWVYVHRADDLSFVRKHKLEELVYGAGGITCKDGRFYVVGGLPKGFEVNSVYEYKEDFSFVRRHELKTGYTGLGIQTAHWDGKNFHFGCYGSSDSQPCRLVCPPSLDSFSTHLPDGALGVLNLKGRLFVARTNSVLIEGLWRKQAWIEPLLDR